jgi:hypothetical protein
MGDCKFACCPSGEECNGPLPGEVFFIGEPKYVGKMPPSELVPCRPPKTVHAIAHFDFDGRCLYCPCAWWHPEVEEGICQLSDTSFELSKAHAKKRHKDCPLCIEED